MGSEGGRKLSDVADLKGGFAFKSGDYSPEGHFILRTVNIRTDGRITREGAVFIPDGLVPEYERFQLQDQDTLFVMVGATLGKVGYVTDADLPALLNQNMWVIRSTDHERADPRFLNYWFQQVVGETLAWASGSARGFVRRDDYRNLGFPDTPLSEQKAIAHILGSLDDKIELNRKVNATLEAMAQALFKSWFVDFDPVIDNALAAGKPIPEALAPRAEIRRKVQQEQPELFNRYAELFPSAFIETDELGPVPAGWQLARLSQLLEVKYGKDHKKLSDGETPVYGSGGLMRHAEASLYEGESVLIPRKGTLSNILYLDEEFWTVDTMFYTIPKIQSVAKYCYYHLKSLDFASMNVGSAVPSMTTKVLNDLPILRPDKAALQHFDGLIASYFHKSEQNNQESQTLTKLRDTLLPKLISGELRVSEAEQITQEAMT